MVRQRKLYNRLNGGRLRSKIPFRRFYSVTDVSATSNLESNGLHTSPSINLPLTSTSKISRQSSYQQSNPSLINGNSSQSDPEHEAFLKAFQIPTTLYRFLAQRHDANSSFLHRNLKYMNGKKQNIRKKEPCKPFSNLETVVGRISDCLAHKMKPNVPTVATSFNNSSTHKYNNTHSIDINTPSSSQLRLKFSGFFDSELEKEWRTVCANLSIFALHRWNHPRKGLSGQSVYPILSNHKLSCFQLADSNSQSTSKKQSPTSPIRLSTTRQSNSPHSSCKALRKRYSTGSDCVELSLDELTRPRDLPGRLENTALLFVIEALEKRVSQNFLLPDKRPRFARISSSNRKLDGYPVRYKSELPLLMKHNGKMDSFVHNEFDIDILPGDYEIRLDVDWKNTKRLLNEDGHLNRAEWQPVHLQDDSPSTQEYSKWPVLRFSAAIHQTTQNVNNTSPGSHHSLCDKLDPHLESPTGKSSRSRSTSPVKPSAATSLPLVATTNGDHHPKYTVSYRFLYNDRLHQWTESRDLICPWCRLNCDRQPPNSLIYHLKLCHPRFQFRCRAVDATKKVIDLDVTINENFNASNDCGMRRGSRDTKRVFANWHKEFVVGQPVHRLPYSQLIYWRILSGDSSNGALSLNYQHLTLGHKRTYNHSLTGLPVRPCEIDIDMESAEHPSWIYNYYWRKIEDFTDLNRGEKLVMQMWNEHLVQNPILGDFQLAALVDSFISAAGSQLKKAGARGNLICHLVTLSDFGTLTPDQLDRAITKLDQLSAE